MDVAEVEENLFAPTDAKLHGGMCKLLSAMYYQVLEIFPVIEAARPRSTTGIQALCSLHIALERAKSLLQHCSECSKLYLAITGDSVLSKFNKARSSLAESLRLVEDIIPQSVGAQISQIVIELDSAVFSLDPLEKQVGDDIISLLQQGSKFDSDDNGGGGAELESFHQSVVRLRITSSRAALAERRSLKKLIERSRIDEDKRKESIVAYLLHLMRKHSKLFRNDDVDSQGSSPCSPTAAAASGFDGFYDRQLSKFSFTLKPSVPKSVVPEELRCPISLQLMYDPVIIGSGQTYERACIEKWFGDGHTTCPKSQQPLDHFTMTPNYAVKSMVSSWCEQHGVPVPDAPPDSLDLNYWSFVMSSETDSISSKSADSTAPAEPANLLDEYANLLDEEKSVTEKCAVVERIRHRLRDDDDARALLGSNGFARVLVGFLKSALSEGLKPAIEVGTMALFNLGVNNDRNKQAMMDEGVMDVVEGMAGRADGREWATALYVNLSCLDEAKAVIGSSSAVPFLVGIVRGTEESQCKADAVHALYNVSTVASNVEALVSSGIIGALHHLFSAPSGGGGTWTEKAMAVLTNVAASELGKDEIVSVPGLVTVLAGVLDTGRSAEQEQAVSCLLALCDGSERCGHVVLQEGVVPALVSVSVNGTARGKEKAQKLLMLFREQRQRDPPLPPPVPASPPEDVHERSATGTPNIQTQKPLHRAVARRKIGRAFSSLWK